MVTVAFNVNPQGQAARAAALTETDRRHDLYHHPLKLLRSTLDPKTTVTNVRSVGAARQADITTAAGPVLTMTIDASGRPLSISSKAYHPNLGDVVMTTTFSEWGDVERLEFAGAVLRKGRRLHHVGNSRHEADARWRGRRSRGARRCRRETRRGSGAERHRRADRQRHLVARRPVASQRARRVRRSPDADRSAAKRSAHAGGDCEGETDRSQQAAHAAGDHPSSLRSHRRHARRDRRRH